MRVLSPTLWFLLTLLVSSVSWAGTQTIPVVAQGLASNAVEETHLKSVNAATDEFCLTYESSVGDFEWQACGVVGITVSGHSTNYTVLEADCDQDILTNDGASGTVIFTLPTDPTPGLHCRFATVNANAIQIDPIGASGCTLGTAVSCNQILGSGGGVATSPGDYIQSAAQAGETIELIAVENATCPGPSATCIWVSFQPYGSWVQE